MVETANRFLAGLGPDQGAKATFKFEDDERMNWHFIPKERKGLPLREMTPYQKHLASALLSAALSQTGYVKAVTIMSLEDVPSSSIRAGIACSFFSPLNRNSGISSDALRLISSGVPRE